MDYTHLTIKIYDLWDLKLHEVQFPYIGRSYAWAKREDAINVAGMTKPERDELFDKIIPDWERAVQAAFGPMFPNYAFLGNNTRHLHPQFVPRFEHPKTFYGLEFADPNYSGNYSPYPKKGISDSILLMIRNELRTLI